ncbi:MAG: ubiquinol-cytochrome c reductase iron-sulfur subunit [Geminicoccaceae bacterium]
MSTALPLPAGHPGGDPSQARRDFLALLSTTTALVGVGAMAWPLIDSMNPSADVLALAQTEVDLAPIQPGQGIIVSWQGRPVFVRHRTPAEIEEARAADLAALRDPQADTDRVKDGHEAWLVVSAVCTHLGCVPGGSRTGETRGEFGGWFCACHGSQYDTSGRIRKGPAPANLPVPPYAFLSDTSIRIG